MKTIEKEFDLVETFENTVANLEDNLKNLEVQTIALNAKKEMLVEIISYLKANNLKVIKNETAAEIDTADVVTGVEKDSSIEAK